MKLLICLKTEYRGGPSNREETLKQFRSAIKQFSYIKVIQEYDNKAETIIELNDTDKDKAYKDLASIDVVDIIDSILPSNY